MEAQDLKWEDPVLYRVWRTSSHGFLRRGWHIGRTSGHGLVDERWTLEDHNFARCGGGKVSGHSFRMRIWSALQSILSGRVNFCKYCQMYPYIPVSFKFQAIPVDVASAWGRWYPSCKRLGSNDVSDPTSPLSSTFRCSSRLLGVVPIPDRSRAAWASPASLLVFDDSWLLPPTSKLNCAVLGTPAVHVSLRIWG